MRDSEGRGLVIYRPCPHPPRTWAENMDLSPSFPEVVTAVPDRRTHRGPHPDDLRLFAPASGRCSAQATADLCWLLSRGYPHDRRLKLVGDRYGLVARQRIAVSPVLL